MTAVTYARPFAPRASRPRPRASVRRPRLVAALATPEGPPLVVLVAPAGFGKTTLLLEWAAADPRPFAWLTLDRRHDDPRVLLQTVARAVDAASAQTGDGRIVLVLDNVHRLRSAAARDTIASIATDLPDDDHGRPGLAVGASAAGRAASRPGPRDRAPSRRAGHDTRRGRHAAARRAACTSTATTSAR